MTETTRLIAILAAGFSLGTVLGAIYFRALWLTVSTLERSKRPALRLALSLALRFLLVLAVFYATVRYGGWQPLLAAAAGFIAVRFLAVRRLGTHPETQANG